MRKLKLPIIKNNPLTPKSLSMDDYLKLVRLHLKYTFDKKAYATWKRKQAVNVPFSLF